MICHARSPTPKKPTQFWLWSCFGRAIVRRPSLDGHLRYSVVRHVEYENGYARLARRRIAIELAGDGYCSIDRALGYGAICP